jgi:hypothetical protein
MCAFRREVLFSVCCGKLCGVQAVVFTDGLVVLFSVTVFL